MTVVCINDNIIYDIRIQKVCTGKGLKEGRVYQSLGAYINDDGQLDYDIRELGGRLVERFKEIETDLKLNVCLKEQGWV